MISFGERRYTNQYDEISGFANTTKFPPPTDNCISEPRKKFTFQKRYSYHKLLNVFIQTLGSKVVLTYFR